MLDNGGPFLSEADYGLIIPVGVNQLLDVETWPCGVDSAHYERMIVL